MAHGEKTCRIDIKAKPEDVFAYISDLAKHSEWNDGLSIEKVSEGDVGVGTEYRSTGKQLGKSIVNTVKVTEFESPRKFSFTGSDGKLEFLQEMSLSEHDGGTRLERTTSAELNPVMAIAFKILIGPLIANPSMNKSLRRLKANLEK
ncbi:MAG: SRPBCC family protein [Chloroflexi bacterium]|nr:SRPBCC family protein [Chloroflexota bacterium]